MIKRILEIAPRWAIASLLLFTSIHAQTDCFRPSCRSNDETDERCNRFWIDADYLYWKIQNSPECVPLVVQNPTLEAAPPVLCSRGTCVVLGGKSVDIGWRSGGRFAFGVQCNDRYSTEINYFFLPNRSQQCSVSSDGLPILAVPYFNVVTAAEDSTPIASPQYSIAGKATLNVTNKVQGAEWNAMASITSRSLLLVLVGFRYWNFKEHLTFCTNSPFNPPHVPDIYTTKDEFNTKNNFFGGQIGLIYQYDYRCFSIQAKGKIALGAMLEHLAINGCLFTNDYNNFEAVVAYQGGYFALPTNIGKCGQTKFAAIPELNLNFGYQLCNWLQIRAGYNFMYATNVLWAGTQIDHNINPTQAVSYTGAIPPLLLGDASPRACLNTKGLWVQGLNVGLEFSF